MPTKRDNVVLCRLAAEQEEVYMRVLDSADYRQLYHSNDPCIHCESGLPTSRCHSLDMEGVLARWKHPDGEECQNCPSCIMLPALVQLGKIANHLELLKPETGDSDELYQKQAEFARMAFGDPGMSVVRDRNFWSQSHATGCGKMKALERLLRIWKGNGSKVLLFSYSTQMLDILEDFVTRQGYTHLRLDGSTSTKQRGERVNKFNTSQSIFLFLLSTKAGGLGINLVSANKVVVFDPNWNPAWDMQAQDRAYRIGQRQDVQVYRLVSSNTIEEKVYHRQLYKQGQEGLVLHQRDETRYFEGVMGDRNQQGELFGVKNLLTFERGESQALQKSGTRSIIKSGRSAFEHELDEEGDGEEEETEDGGDDFVIRRVNRLGKDEDGDEGDALDDSDLGAEAGVEWLLRKVDPQRSKTAADTADAVMEEGSEEQISEVLRNSGAVHTHLNSRVLGGAPLESFRKSGGEGRGGGAGDDSVVSAKRKAAVEPAPLAAKPEPEPKAPKVRPAENLDLNMAPTDVACCIGDCRTYEEYFRRLHRDADFAWRAEYCREELGLSDELMKRVKQLPPEAEIL